MLGQRLQDRLGGRRRMVEALKRLAPPGQPDAPNHRVAARREDSPESDVKTPQALQSGACGGGYIGERETTVGVEVDGQR